MAAAKCLVCVLVVVLAEVCVVRAEDRIKMCGRELIRLAVSTCGNSRLRRSIPNKEVGQDQHTTDWVHDSSTQQDQTSEMLHISPQSDGKRVVSSLAPYWYHLTSRNSRAAGKISDICCEKGCSMKELIQFC
ncbi:insulin-like 3 (Leydig cell) [Kryptolebias marmoratus]|uniref:insulin-like 3 (Leydig cell) n=1 Tax=Kryptolebias marmoratus TaxID=37003 RepID=UPI0007F8BB63|nr:insulin-like 3 (Leydig cell) [Kryptolebias marmoratus]